MSVFQHTNYKDYLRAKVADAGARSGYQTRLAEAAGCQKSFLSQVLNGSVHLTNDHAAGLAVFWHFTEDETAYFLDLVALDRSASAKLTAFLKRRLALARDRQAQVQMRYKTAATLPPEDLVDYYTSWILASVHVLVSIPAYRQPERIAERLKLSPGRVAQALTRLARLGLVREEPDGWRVEQHDLFLPNGSPLARMHHMIWRERAIQDLENGEGDAFHFSSLYAISRADVARFRELLLRLVAEFRSITPASPEEEMVCVNCDLFRV